MENYDLNEDNFVDEETFEEFKFKSSSRKTITGNNIRQYDVLC